MAHLPCYSPLEVVAVAVLAVADLVADSSVVAVSVAADLEEDFKTFIVDK